jgi:hypothetical protein
MMTTEEFDVAVKALRGKVVPKQAKKKRADCTPEEWAAGLDYLKAWSSANREKRRAAVKRWRDANPEKGRDSRRVSDKKYRSSNRSMVLESKRNYRAANPDKVAASVKAWRAANPENVRAKEKAWRDANRERVRANARNNKSKRLKTDLHFQMSCALRKRTYMAVKGGAKQGSAVRDLGCSIAEFWVHMESLFQPGMTRENMGTAWEIDHIFPLAKANLKESRVEFLAVANWRNLQPLTPKQNNDKGDGVTPESQALFDSLCAAFAR